MGIAPLASIELFSKSPAERKQREQSLVTHIRSTADIDSSNFFPHEFFNGFQGTIRSDDEPHKDVKLTVSRLTVADRSCYSRLSLFDIRMGRPKASCWARANEFCRDLLARGLCDSVMLGRGCSSGILGLFHSPAVLAAPVVARLAILSMLDMLLVERLDLIVRNLDFSGTPELYCMKTWNKVVRECRADPMLSILVKPL